MGMFEQLGKQTQQQAMNPMQMLQQIRSNPVEFLKQRGFNIPDGMDSPQAITNYLMQSGQVGSQRMQMARQMLNKMMGGKS